jgi:antirestriction protein ArdC
MIVFWKMLRVEDKETGEPKRIPILNSFRVFNVEQTEGITPNKAMREWQEARDAATADGPRHDPIAAAEAICAGYVDGPEIHEGADSAYYNVAVDGIWIPAMGQYANPHDYYSTKFHEMGHSTGHCSRCNRPDLGNYAFGSHPYGREELVAEMTAAFLAAEAGIESHTLDQNAAYLASWVRTIRADPRAVVVAAGAAQRAADRILGRTAAVASDDDEEAAPAAATAVALAA